MNKIKLVITRMPRRWSYFQFFLLGFYELEKLNEIELEFKCDWFARISTAIPHINFLERILLSINVRLNKDFYNLEGYIEKESKKYYFCIDSADAPFLFDKETLEKVDVYFKMQCPNEFNEAGFRLTDEVIIPWCDHKKFAQVDKCQERRPHVDISKYVHKIKPCIVGFRCLGLSNSFICLKEGYENYKKNRSNIKSQKLMCYFGNAKGPIPTENVKCPDWDAERDIMGFYANKLEHPNVKRAKIADIIRARGKGYDARVISEGNADTSAEKNKNLIVPLKDFCNFVSNFEYNTNLSGYRMSIPNRFIESFVVGTAILTDKLAVKWYLPFDEEVQETIEMGYLPDEFVDYVQVEKDIDNLPKVSKEKIIQLYEEKWSPIVVAKYIINTCLKSKEL